MTWLTLGAFVVGALVALYSVSFANVMRRKRDDERAWQDFRRSMGGK
jgi:uncharacterized integral membrane protein